MTRTVTIPCATCNDAGYVMRTDETGWKAPALCPGCTPKEPAPSKYHNQPVTVDSMRFDSKAEAGRWGQLVAAQEAGAITNLRRQVRYPLDVNGLRVCDYVADHVYDENGVTVVEDVKGMETAVYRIKRKLMLAVYGVAIREVRK